MRNGSFGPVALAGNLYSYYEHTVKLFSVDAELTSSLQEARALVNAEGGEILVLNQGTPPSVFTTGSPLHLPNDALPNRSSPQDTIIGWFSQTNDLLTLFGPEHDPRFIPPAGLSTTTALVALPFQGEFTPIGYLALWRSGRPFGSEEIALLRAVVDKRRTVVEAAHAYSELERALARRTEELTLLVDAGAAFSSARDLDGLLPLLARKMAQSVETTFCRIALLDEDDECLTARAFFALHDIGPDPAAGLGFAVEELPYHRQVIDKREPLFLSDDQPSPLLEPERSLLFGLGARSILLVPLAVKDRAFGLAIMGEVRRRERSAIFPEKVNLSVAMARQAALAIENILSLQSVQLQQQRIQLIIDSVADGVFRAGSRGEILTFNPAAEKITGYAAAEVIGRSCSDVLRGVSPDGKPQCQTNCPLVRLASPAADLQPVHSKEWITRKDGTKTLIAHTISPFILREGQVSGTVSILRDITREEELVRLKSELISMISHELRTPLASISASTQLLARADLDSDARSSMTELLNRQCNRLMRLADQVLDASRLEKGRIELTLEPVALFPLIEETIGTFRSLHPDHPLIVQDPPRPVFALGDPVSIGIVLENLIRNAISYSPKNTPVTISVEKRDDQVVVAVRDEGIGIPADQLDRVFQQFHQVRLASKESGFGLGLYIAKMLVEAQGGKIWAESEPKKGSCFRFTLRKLNDAQDSDY